MTLQVWLFLGGLGVLVVALTLLVINDCLGYPWWKPWGWWKD